MAGPYVVADAVLDQLAGHLQGADRSALGDKDFLRRLVPQAIQRGYSEIVRRLTARGYTLTQIDSWDDKAEFNLDLALFWVGEGMRTHVAQNSDERTAIKVLDRRAELDSVEVLSGGVPILPAPPAAGGAVGAGVLKVLADYDARQRRDCRDRCY